MQGEDRAAAAAYSILKARRSRANFLPAELFHEPAWDLLLELFVADAEGRRLTGREVSDAANVTPSVMSRWLKHLTRLHLIIGDGTGNLDDELTLSATALKKIERIMTTDLVPQAVQPS